MNPAVVLQMVGNAFAVNYRPGTGGCRGQPPVSRVPFAIGRRAWPEVKGDDTMARVRPAWRCCNVSSSFWVWVLLLWLLVLLL